MQSWADDVDKEKFGGTSSWVTGGHPNNIWSWVGGGMGAKGIKGIKGAFSVRSQLN
jgi:hypothetical protein